jgi:hypothetical protein
MILTIYQKKVYPNALYFSRFEIECPGAGTKEDPVIFEPFEDIPKALYLRDYDIFILIRNLDKKYISLINCRNITMTDCQLQYLDIFKCSNIKIKNLSVVKLSRLYASRDLRIEDTFIEKIKLKQSSSNFFKNCSFNKIEKTLSPNNNFELIKISGKPVSDIDDKRFKAFSYKWDLPSLLYTIVLFLIFFFLIPYILDFNIPIPFFIGAIVLFIFWYILSILIRRRKMVK